MRHMLDAAQDALDFMADKNRESLDEDRILAFAVVKALEIVGEAAARVSREKQATLPNLPWSQMISMRNRLTHGYYDVNLDVVWQTIIEDLPAIISELEKAIPANLE